MIGGECNDGRERRGNVAVEDFERKCSKRRNESEEVDFA